MVRPGIIEHIRKGRVTQMATIKMVADYAGVSTATVSRALSSPDLVTPETRKKVQKAIEHLGYAPNFNARSLRALRTTKIVMMVPDIANPFFSEVVQGAEEAAQLAGYSVLLGDTKDDAERENQYASMLLSNEVDGVIFLGHRLPAILSRMVSERGFRAPVVNACDFTADHGISGVRIDNEAAAFAATELLLAMGHHHLGVIAGPLDSPITQARLAGVRRCLGQQGLGEQVRVSHGSYTMEDGAEEASAFLQSPERPTALFCFSDELALGALSALRTVNLSCPGDVSIVGFDDVRFARFVAPPLTTVRQPMRRIGESAVNLLLSILAGRSETQEIVTLQHELVMRQSTGPAHQPG
ncbi:LacI family DNA-binding transcriptional regulator [Sphingobium chlorophenolicum]|nr:LacI family DNA-binding transcriptional regulator [Sphingobium chlorophenolicum]